MIKQIYYAVSTGYIPDRRQLHYHIIMYHEYIHINNNLQLQQSKGTSDYIREFISLSS